jgi:DNA polymerase
LNKQHFSFLDAGEVEQFRRYVNEAIKLPDVVFVAHVAVFEMRIWKNILTPKFGISEVPLSRWRDTAAKAAAFALPRTLEGACAALNLPAKKNVQGAATMRKFCKPQKDDTYYENEEAFERLKEYCLDDVIATVGLDNALPDLSEYEQEVWEMDYEINERGFCVDIPAIDRLMEALSKKEAEHKIRISEITNGQISSTNQVAASLKWLATKGVELPDLTKATVSAALRRKGVASEVREFLHIRQQLSKSSVKKFKTMKARANEEGAVRGTFTYHGANTGRWAGNSVQAQNLARPVLTEAQEGKGYEAVVDEILELDVDLLEAEYGGLFFAASSALRGLIVPRRGKLFLCSDYSAIENRVLGEITGEPAILNAYIEGLDIYKVAAEKIYMTAYGLITKDQRQIGKVATLALGYQGWVGAFHSMAKNYGVEVTDEEAAAIANRWREGHPEVIRFWTNIESAAKLAVENPGKIYSYRGIKYTVQTFPAGFSALRCKLPSGRILTYNQPSLEKIEKNGKKKLAVSYMGVNGYSRKWERLYTYGGKLTENIVQAISRDLLVYGMLNVRKSGLPIVMHVHDEIVAEIPERYEQNAEAVIRKFESLITELPEWAKEIPLAASGSWVGRRYRK